MSIVIKKVKIMMLKRQLKEVIGNIDFYSDLLDRWEKQRVTLEPQKHDSFFAANEYNKIEGQINFNRKRIVVWIEKKKKLYQELGKLGVETFA